MEIIEKLNLKLKFDTDLDISKYENIIYITIYNLSFY